MDCPSCGETIEAATASFWDRRGRLAAASLAGTVFAVAIIASLAGAGRASVLMLLGVSTVAGGWFVVPRGLRAARTGTLDMNFLMTVAALGAWLIGEQAEAAATLSLFAVAELLEAYSMDRARNAIRALMDLSPAEATVLRDGREVRVPITDIGIGETVAVRPGEKLPADGIVTSGRSSVNQAPITGESMPVDKDVGAEVFAGTINGMGLLHVRSTKGASDTTLARIVRAVEEAQSSRAPTQRFVDRFARVYTPTVVAGAVVLAVLPPLLGLGSWYDWIYRSLAMLVVACPCALVISTPVTIVSGLAGAARAGVLIKGGAFLEAAGAITTICFDKTGTLTLGAPTVTDVVVVGQSSQHDVIRLAMAVERGSEHPLANAIMQYGVSREIETPNAIDFEALVGRGARAGVDGELAFIGNARLLQELGIRDAEVSRLMNGLEEHGKTAVAVMRGTVVIGVVAVADEVRPNAAEALAQIRAVGVRRTIMLTGDNRRTAEAVAASIGIDEVHAELLPDQKVAFVRDLEERGERVAFVGDGVNDAPALAAASVGIAMGAAGTDVALETADIALMADDLSKLATAITLSRRTRRIVQQNVWFAIAVKATFVVLAGAGFATLWVAVAADMGASLVVVLNGLRPLRTANLIDTRGRFSSIPG
ncbi:MAG: heavy metal translocating P-type ATPase [Gemmatimonadaceae bacterium]